MSKASREAPASAVLRPHLRAQVAAIVSLDPQVRDDAPDAVHQMRVAGRRLRSALATFRPLVEREITDPVREELTWLAGVLGDARDVEVMRDRLNSLVARETTEAATREPGTHLERVLTEAHDSARGRVDDAMETGRYHQLIDELTMLSKRPPWTPRAQRPAARVLPKRVHRDWGRLHARVVAADDARTSSERTERLHDVRKAAKRVRYASEALAPVFGHDAEELGKAAKQLQTVLGEYQDSAVSQELLRELAAQTDIDQRHALLYARLHALELAQSTQLEKQYEAVWQQASKKQLRQWLTS